jgi:hypothetical protein
LKDILKYLQVPLLARENKDDLYAILILNEGFIKEHPEDKEYLLAGEGIAFAFSKLP